jgi:hypothetical protein
MDPLATKASLWNRWWSGHVEAFSDSGDARGVRAREEGGAGSTQAFLTASWMALIGRHAAFSPTASTAKVTSSIG